jgi:hypothetical protein
MLGFKIVEQLLEEAELRPVVAGIEAGLASRSKAGARHILGMPAVRELANHPKMLALATEFVGPSPFPFRATLFDKSPDKNWLVAWHQDTALPLRERNDSPDWGPWSVKAGLLYA